MGMESKGVCKFCTFRVIKLEIRALMVYDFSQLNGLHLRERAQCKHFGSSFRSPIARVDRSLKPKKYYS